jgi:hypothetical protein
LDSDGTDISSDEEELEEVNREFEDYGEVRERLDQPEDGAFEDHEEQRETLEQKEDREETMQSGEVTESAEESNEMEEEIKIVEEDQEMGSYQRFAEDSDGWLNVTEPLDGPTTAEHDSKNPLPRENQEQVNEIPGNTVITEGRISLLKMNNFVTLW